MAKGSSIASAPASSSGCWAVERGTGQAGAGEELVGRDSTGFRPGMCSEAMGFDLVSDS